jgi:hypothetical protein
MSSFMIALHQDLGVPVGGTMDEIAYEKTA